MADPVRSRLRRLARLFGPAAGLVAVAVLFALLTGAPERYLSAANLRIVLAQTVIVALGAIGMTLIMISGGIDLSVGASIALTSVIAALALRGGASAGGRGGPRRRRGRAVGLVNGAAITECCASCRSSPPSACSASRAARRSSSPNSRP